MAVKLFTNPGSNLSAALIDRYQVAMFPQHILVDGALHQTRNVTPDEVDGWVKTAKKWPETIGTTAAETAQGFDELVKAGHRDLLGIYTSQKIINSYASGSAARRAFLDSRSAQGVRIELFDTQVTDAAALLHAVYAGEAVRAGKNIDEVLAVLAAFSRGGVLGVGLATLDNMVRGRRASFLRAFMADLLGVRPVLSMKDGELAVVDKVSAKLPLSDVLAAHVTARVAKGRRVFVAVAHGKAEGAARALEASLRSAYDVAYLVTVPIAAGVYLHAGPGSLLAAVYPIDDLPWAPPTL